MHVERRKSEFTSALTTRLSEQLTFQDVFCFSFAEYTSADADISHI
jgi:hypothetical protein